MTKLAAGLPEKGKDKLEVSVRKGTLSKIKLERVSNAKCNWTTEHVSRQQPWPSLPTCVGRAKTSSPKKIWWGRCVFTCQRPADPSLPSPAYLPNFYLLSDKQKYIRKEKKYKLEKNGGEQSTKVQGQNCVAQSKASRVDGTVWGELCHFSLSIKI